MTGDNKSIAGCRLFDKANQEWIEYDKPTFIKLFGVYGYLTVSLNKVYFFWADNESDCRVDDITERFDIEYNLL